MKATELRIGNIVMCEGLIQTVECICDTDSGEAECCLSLYGNYAISISPIPLTEEWLLKFGFKVYNEHGWYEINNYHQINLIGDYLVNGVQCISNKINYVHQLQNLYFATTGNELTITK